MVKRRHSPGAPHARLVAPRRGAAGGPRRRAGEQDSDEFADEDSGSSSSGGAAARGRARQQADEQPSFKNPRFARADTYYFKRHWKSLAYVLEQSQPTPAKECCYSAIEAPPTVFPPGHFCDVTGLAAKYTDPRTGLRFASVQTFALINGMAHETAQGYLRLRGAASIIR